MGDDQEGDWRVDCNSLEEIRREIDKLDAQIAPLLSQRLHYVRQAARFKSSKQAVVVVSREEEIMRNVARFAQQYGAPPEVIQRVYRAMIDGFTAEEIKNWDSVHPKA